MQDLNKIIKKFCVEAHEIKEIKFTVALVITCVCVFMKYK